MVTHRWRGRVCMTHKKFTNDDDINKTKMTQQILIKCDYKILLRNKNDKYVQYEVINNNYNLIYITL